MRFVPAIALACSVAGVDRRAAADPVLPPRVIHAQTARILPRGMLHATAGANHRLGGTVIVTGGLAGLAEVELGVVDDVVVCEPCEPGGGTRSHRWPLVAGFKLGVGQGAWFRGQPALALGLRTTAGGRPLPWNAPSAKIAELFAVASTDLGAGVRVHAGAAMWASRHVDPDGTPVVLDASTKTIRPFAAAEYTPSIYPRTTLVGDVGWTPELEARATRLRWIGGWGVRYQAFAWGSVELEVRHREDVGLSGSTVLVRVNGVFPRR